MSDTSFGKFICILSLVSIIFLSGCHRGNRARDLYIDAVMHAELQENEEAIAKLNSAVQLNKKYSLAYSLLGDIYMEIREYEKSVIKTKKFSDILFKFKGY